MTPIRPSGFLPGRDSRLYTDGYGRNGRTEPFPGSLRQRIASVDNDIGVDVNGPTIGQNRSYSGSGMRAPN